MDQNSGLNTMNLNAAIASLNSSGYGGFSSGQMSGMMGGLSNMGNVNPMGMMGADQYNPGQPYHQQTYQPQQPSYQPQYAQQSQLYQQQPPSQQYQRAYQPALPMTSNMSSLENNGNSDDGSSSNDYREFKERTLDVCREFMRGFCNRNEDRCKFAHPPPFVDVKDGKVIVCFDFAKNRCRRTQPPCRYMHPPPHLCPDFGGNIGNVGPRRSSSRTGEYVGNREGYNRRNDGPRSFDRGPVYNQPDRYEGFAAAPRRSGNGYGESQWCPPPSRNAPRRDDRRPDSRPRSTTPSWGYQGRYGEGQRSDQIEVCREFLRNNCDRQECKYAHPPPHVKVDNGHVVYCIDHVVKGSCRKGDECRYFHMPRHLAIRYGKIDPRGVKRTYDEMRDDRDVSRSPRDDDRPSSRAGSEEVRQEGTPTFDEPTTASAEESVPVQKMEEDKQNEADVLIVSEVKEEDNEVPVKGQPEEMSAALKNEEVVDAPVVEVEKPEEEDFDSVKKEEATSTEAEAEVEPQPCLAQEATADVKEEESEDCNDLEVEEYIMESQDDTDPQDDEPEKEQAAVEEAEEKKREDVQCEEHRETKEEAIADSFVIDEKEEEDEAYIEGPPQKRIALDADFAEGQQSS